MGTVIEADALQQAFSALFGAAIVPYDPYADDLLNSLLPPSAEHWFGTDLKTGECSCVNQ